MLRVCGAFSFALESSAPVSSPECANSLARWCNSKIILAPGAFATTSEKISDRQSIRPSSRYRLQEGNNENHCSTRSAHSRTRVESDSVRSYLKSPSFPIPAWLLTGLLHVEPIGMQFLFDPVTPPVSCGDSIFAKSDFDLLGNSKSQLILYMEW